MKKKGLGIMGLIVGILAVFGLTLTGCVTTPEPGYSQKKELVHKSEIVIGSSFSFKRTDFVTGEVTTWSRVFEKRAPHKNRGVFYWKKLTERNGVKPAFQNYRLFDSGLNLVAIVRDGIEIRSWYPSRLSFKWPLYAGKRWTGRFEFERFGQKKRTIVNGFSVEGIQEVRVPAGTFQAFKIIRTSPILKEIYWYAPKIGIVIKREVNFQSSRETIRSLKELIDYNIPK